jgi:hypothetical protein
VRERRSARPEVAVERELLYGPEEVVEAPCDAESLAAPDEVAAPEAEGAAAQEAPAAESAATDEAAQPPADEDQG